MLKEVARHKVIDEGGKQYVVIETQVITMHEGIGFDPTPFVESTEFRLVDGTTVLLLEDGTFSVGGSNKRLKKL